ncbi:LacI family DNA-binding transcriptional regulator [Aquibacillus saliphilus]|uniref:LacI family DNA-binding transcriptional regulator n=1 Tax=Aquibacillus saliphilus TaxID=1909422 RepID=UPI001CF017FA|nr:LacI family DNA-binding transcriptional regulator [Aquibacillus saliphilus]
MVTIYDIAKNAKVSPMTVSRVINNSGNIRLTTREKVEKAIKELGYVPNSAARSLISKRTKTLGLILSDISNPFFSKVARGAEDKAVEMGYSVFMTNTDEDFEKEKNYINRMLSSRVDGVILSPTNNNSIKHIQKLNQHNIPVVLFDRTIDGFVGDHVLGDSYKGSRDLVKHLIDIGHEKIALVNGPHHLSTSRERQRAYVETLKLNDLSIHEHYISELDFRSVQSEDAHQILMKLMSLDKKKQPTAIFAANNFIAISIIRSLREMNINVPEDVSIVCFDEIEHVHFDPFFTVASQPALEIGRISAQYLIERLENDNLDEERIVILPPEIHIRKSSKPLIDKE